MENVVHGDVHADLVYLQQLSLFRNNINISMNMNMNMNNMNDVVLGDVHADLVHLHVHVSSFQNVNTRDGHADAEDADSCRICAYL